MTAPTLHFRVTSEQKAEIEARAKAAGYTKLSPYLRDRALGQRASNEIKDGVQTAVVDVGGQIDPDSLERTIASVLDEKPTPKQLPGGSSVPVAEQPETSVGFDPVPNMVAREEAEVREHLEGKSVSIERADFITARSCQLFGTGITRKRAREQAECEWAEAHPVE